MATMQWSKLRTRVEAYFADSVKGRVGLHSTRYRTTHDQDGRAWITIDGREVVNMPFLWKYLPDLDERAAQLSEKAGLPGPAGVRHMYPLASLELMNEGKFMQVDLGSAMHDYLSMSIDEILHSRDPIIRAIGMLDRRLGERRLRQLDVSAEHPLVKEMFEFRRTAEGERRRRGRTSTVPRSAV